MIGFPIGFPAAVEQAVILDLATQLPMYLTTDLKPNTDFTRVPNQLIFDNSLTPAEMRLWMRLLAYPKGAAKIHLTWEDLAKEFDMSVSVLRATRRSLRKKGYLVVNKTEAIVTLPEEGHVVEEKKLTPEQQLREDLRKVWNENKPEGYSGLRHPFSAEALHTLRLHAEHNDCPSLTTFLARVLQGCKADDWWSTKSLGVANVLGSGNPKQNKFTNVEKLYKLSSSKKGRAKLFDVDSDQCWIDWYASKAHEMDKVVRLEMERYDAWEHQVEHEGDKTIYLYTHENSLVHWTYKEGQHGVSYLPTAK